MAKSIANSDSEDKGKKFKNKIIPLENLTMEDINFPEFCFGIIGKTPFKDQPDELLFVDKLNPDAKIAIIKSKFGLPTQFTRDLRLALIKIAMRKNGFSSEQTEATASEILREMGLGDSGPNFASLKKHMDILVNTRIKFFNSYFDKTKGESVRSELDFSILQGYLITEQNSGNNNGFKGYFLWQKFFYENSVKNAKNLIDLDYLTYTQLRGDITKQLYSFLNKRSFGKSEFRIPLDVLGYTKLGISTERSLSKLRFELRKAHLNLVKCGFLAKDPEFIKNTDKTEHVVYTFGSKQLLNQNDIDFLESVELDSIKSKLLELGFTEGQIGKIKRDFTEKQIIDSIDLLGLEKKNKKILDPKKWFFACLKRGFDMTSLEAARNNDKQQKIDLFKSQNLEQEQLQYKELAEEKLKLVDDAVNYWIQENPAQYIQKCNELYQELKDKNQVFFVKVIDEGVVKTGKTVADVIIDHSILRSMVRENIQKSFDFNQID